MMRSISTLSILLVVTASLLCPTTPQFIVGKVSADTSASQAGWRVQIEAGKSTRSTLAINNHCLEPHLFRIKSSAKYLQFEQPTDSVLIAARTAKQLGVRFDATGLKSKVYRSKVVVECLDCRKKMSKCTQDRDEVPVELTVIWSPTLNGETPAEHKSIQTRERSPSDDADAKWNARAASAERSFRTAISAQLAEAAQRDGVTFMPDSIAYAAGDGGFVVSTAVRSPEQLETQFPATGKDLLFVYIGASGRVVPEGYYKVRLTGKQAQFIDSNDKVAATLEAKVEPGGPEVQDPTAMQQKHKRRKVEVTVSVGWGTDGPILSVEIRFGRRTAVSSEQASTVAILIPAKSSL
jgi:hypothetical protein